MPRYLLRQVITIIAVCMLGVVLCFIVLDLEKQAEITTMILLSCMLSALTGLFIWYVIRLDKQERAKALQVYHDLSPYGFNIEQDEKTGNYELTRASNEETLTISKELDVYELELLRAGIRQGIAYCNEQKETDSSISEESEE